ncbi:MAG: TrkA family potassium uptake protein [Acidimicrobiia bacterium]|nr:TrkA family potassium uptake protein [Acidimicrobiia bacterium]MDX2467621.1 TrkA family potassium uptake protein [Acidimicrobiia bacterium]
MRILVIGGGKVGASLGRTLDAAGHVVSLIEANSDRAADLIEDVDFMVFQGDGSDVELLQAADVARVDWAVAVTGQDEDNLVTCELARTFGAKNVLARLNNPLNGPTFEALGVPTVGVTSLMAQVISREVELVDLSRLAVIEGGNVSLVERILPDDYPPTMVTELQLPRPSLLITLIRDGHASVPGPNTVLQARDKVLAVVPLENEKAFSETFESYKASE